MICVVCGKEFSSNYKRQITCSEKCSKIEHSRKCQKAAKRRKELTPEVIEFLKETDPMALCPHKDCMYRGTTGMMKTCDYFLITGERRGQPVEKCTRWRGRLKCKQG